MAWTIIDKCNFQRRPVDTIQQMPTKHLLSKGRKQDSKRNASISWSGAESRQALEQRQVWACAVQKTPSASERSSRTGFVCRSFLEEETPAESPELWTSFHVLQIREHTLVTGSRQEVGLSRAGGTCGALLSISTTTYLKDQIFDSYINLINHILLQGSNIWHGTRIRLTFTLSGTSPKSPCF